MMSPSSIPRKVLQTSTQLKQSKFRNTKKPSRNTTFSSIPYLWTPMVTYGQLHPNVIKFIKTKSVAIVTEHGGYASVIANYLFCRLSIILQAANAYMILDKISHIAHKRSRNLSAHFAPHQDALDTAIASLDARSN